MKNLVVISILFLISIVAISQRRKEFQLRVGYGMGSTQSNIDWKYSSGSFTATTEYEQNMHWRTIPVELRYEINERINLGIGCAGFKRILVDENTSVKQNVLGGSLWLAGEYNLVNKENSRLYAGINASYCRIEDDGMPYIGSRESKGIIKLWRGWGTRLNLGGIAYFGNSPIGIMLNLSGGVQRLKLYDMEISGKSIGIENTVANRNLLVYEAHAGIVCRIRGKQK